MENGGIFNKPQSDVTLTAKVNPAVVTTAADAEDIQISVDARDDQNRRITDLTSNYVITDAEDAPVELEDAVQTPGIYTITPTYTSNSKYNVTVVPATLTVKDAEYVCVNLTTGVYYQDVCEAITEAVSGETVQMLADDCTDNMWLIGGAGKTLDLNGYTVEADYIIFVNGSDVVDNSASNEGLLIPVEQINLGADNAQVPIYDEAQGGYVFSVYSISSQARYNKETDTLSLQFVAYIETKNGMYAQYFGDANGATDNKAAIAVEGAWNFETGRDTDLFSYKDSVVSEVVQSYTTSNRQMYTFQLTNCAEYMEYGDIQLTPVIHSSGTGVTIRGKMSVTTKD